MRRLVGAVRYLTILPVRGLGASPGECVPYFPLVGVAAAAAGAQLFVFFDYFLGGGMAALLVVGFWSWITGGRHEAGLAAVVEAAPRGSRSHVADVRKSTLPGALGALALIFMVAIRWQAMQRMPAQPIRELAGCFALSRAALVAMSWTTRPVGDVPGSLVSVPMTSFGALVAIASSLVAVWVANPQLALPLTVGAVVVSWLLREWFDAKMGGVSGPCLDATCLIVETVLMGVASCRNCFW